jgi:hypothetical protein
LIYGERGSSACLESAVIPLPEIITVRFVRRPNLSGNPELTDQAATVGQSFQVSGFADTCRLDRDVMAGIDWAEHALGAAPTRFTGEASHPRSLRRLCGIHLHRCVIAPGKLLPLPLSLRENP